MLFPRIPAILFEPLRVTDTIAASFIRFQKIANSNETKSKSHWKPKALFLWQVKFLWR